MTRVAGVDGCLGGWLVLVLDTRTRALHALLLERLEKLLERALEQSLDLVAIDIPLGLPQSGPRRCDTLARKRLGPGRASSVFSAPIRPLLDCATYQAACDLGRSIDRRAISRQTWNILNKIREADSLLTTQQRPFPLHEVHPELSFSIWSDGATLPSKKTSLGRSARLELVERYLPGAFERVRAAVPRASCKDDDILDACAALWSAERLLTGVAVSLPSEADYDERGIRMQIAA